MKCPKCFKPINIIDRHQVEGDYPECFIWTCSVPQMLYHWDSQNLNVIIPKKSGKGFLKVPFKKRSQKSLSYLGKITGCELFGLDGALSFDCGLNIAGCSAKRKKFQELVLPALKNHYGFDFREASSQEFWNSYFS